MPIHGCIQFRGSGPGCGDCKVKERGFCEQMVAQLERITKNRNFNSYFRPSLLDERDREEIFSSIVENVLKSIDTFEGRNDARFGTWLWGIKDNVLPEFLRSAYERRRWIGLVNPEKGIGTESKADTEKGSGPTMESSLEDIYERQKTDRETSIDVIDVLSIIKTKFGAINPKCANLIISWYGWLKEGLSQEEMADRLEMKGNTFNVSLGRCFQRFKNFLNL